MNRVVHIIKQLQHREVHNHSIKDDGEQRDETCDLTLSGYPARDFCSSICNADILYQIQQKKLKHANTIKLNGN